MRSAIVLVATAASLVLPGFAGFLPVPVRAGLVGIGICCLPGWLLIDAMGIDVYRWAERLALAFPLSLAALVPAAALAFATGGGTKSITAFLILELALATVIASIAYREKPKLAQHTQHADTTTPQVGLVILAVALGAAVTAAAVALTPTGSIDRWWYLGYVRAWMQGPFDWSEPFLGTGRVNARFANNAWLIMLAVWADASRVAPLWLFERACPAVLVPLALAAHLALGRRLFPRTSTAWATVVCAALFWSGGGLVAVLTRVPEDKVLVIAVLAPIWWVSALRALDGERRWVAACIGAALAAATVHPLLYFIAMLALAGPLLSHLLGTAPERRRAIVLAAALCVVSLWPASAGVQSRVQYAESGAALRQADHPIARVHLARDRLIDASPFGYAVDPRLLAHPVSVLALLAIPLVWLGKNRGCRWFLLPAALLPLTIAFVPPVASIAGYAILPWMVHRVLWAIPFAPLAAITIDTCARALGGRNTLVALLLVAATAPTALENFQSRSRPTRRALLLPDDAPLLRVLEAIRRLPAEALVAAAPEISERLPALTGRRVLAMSDRATIVFAGSRELGEARLRARATIFTGAWEPLPQVPSPTHILSTPSSPAMRYCRENLVEDERFILCAFQPAPLPPAAAMAEAPASADGPLVINPDQRGNLAMSCSPPAARHRGLLVWPRPGPWAVDFTLAACRVRFLGAGGLTPRTLRIQPLLGSAVDELTIQVVARRAGRLLWRARTHRRFSNDELVRFELPWSSETPDTLELTLAPEYLPFLKLRSLEITAAGPAY